MKTVFLSRFSKDLDKLKNASIKKRLIGVIEELKMRRIYQRFVTSKK